MGYTKKKQSRKSIPMYTKYEQVNKVHKQLSSNLDKNNKSINTDKSIPMYTKYKYKYKYKYVNKVRQQPFSNFR